MINRKALILILIGGVVAISTSAVLIRLAEAAPASIAFYRLFFATLLFLPFALKQNKEQRISAQELAYGAIAGVLLALHFLFWMTSLEHTSVASSVVLVTTQPLWVFLLSVLFLQERPTKVMWGGLFLALFGSTLVIFAEGTGEASRLYGNLLAVAGAIMMALYLLVGGRLRHRLPLALYSSVVYGSASLVLALFILWRDYAWVGYSQQTWLIFLALAVVPTALGHNSLNWALKYLPATLVSVAILAEPVGASLLAAFVLGEIPALLEISASFITLLGIFLVWAGSDSTKFQ